MQIYKRIIVFLAVLVFLFHFFATLVYVSDGKFTPWKVNYWVGKYMIPLFHQNWKVFGPEPPMESNRLYYRVRLSDGSWSRWTDPGFKWILKHQSNRLSYYGKKYYIHKRIIRQLELQRGTIISKLDIGIEDDTTNEYFFQRIITTPEFQLVQTYVRDMYFESDSISFDTKIAVKTQAELAIIYFVVPPRKERLEKRSLSAVRFPVFEIKK